MKKRTHFAKKSFVFAWFACLLTFNASSPGEASYVQATCTYSQGPCTPVDCSYYQCILDQTYYATSAPYKCQAVRETYKNLLASCPNIANCYLSLTGCY